MAVPKKKNNKARNLVDFTYTLGTFDNFIKLFCSENNLIDFRIFNKLNTLFELSNFEPYEDDIEMVLRIRIIKKLLDVRINDHIMDSSIYLSELLDGENDDEVEQIFTEIYYSDELSNEDVKHLDTYISKRVINAHLFEYLPQFEDLAIQLKAGTTSIDRMNEKATALIDGFSRATKVAKAEVDASSNDFTSRRKEAVRIVDKVIKTKKDSVCLKTAVKELNRTLNGGFYNSRLYMLLAAPKKGKSTTLLNLAIQCKDVNSKFKTKDPTKRPAIVYLTQENTVYETVERLWSYYFGGDQNAELSNYTLDEAIEKINNAGFINDDNDDDGVVFCVKYRKNKTINANDIKDILMGLSEEGLECIGLFHDYLKRLRSIDKGSDERIEYGNISNDLSDLCKELDIPIISAMQLSRKAVEIIENKSLNAGKNLGSSLIGESFLIIENVDAAIIVNLTKTKDGKSYMFFKLTEPRYNVPDDANWDFYQPFDHGMKMNEDWDLAEGNAVKSLSSDLIMGEGDEDNFESPVTYKKKSNLKSKTTKGIIPKLELDTDPLEDIDDI